MHYLYEICRNKENRIVDSTLLEVFNSIEEAEDYKKEFNISNHIDANLFTVEYLTVSLNLGESNEE